MTIGSAAMASTERSFQPAPAAEISQKSRLVFVPSNQTQVRTFLPVCHEIESLAPGVDMRFVSIDHFNNLSAHVLLQANGLPWIELEHGLPFESFWEMPPDERRRALNSARHGMASILGNLCPDLIVLGNDMGICERIALQESARRGIPSLLIQDGSLALPYEVDLHTGSVDGQPFSLEYVSYGVGGCTRAAVMGPAYQEVLRAKGVPKEQIVVTGQPRFDGLALEMNSELAIAQLSPVLPPGWLGRPYILLVSEGFKQPDNREVIESVISALGPILASYNLVIKLHPAENMPQYQPRLQFPDHERIWFTRDASIHSLLAQAELALIFPWSTVLLEAVLMHKPTISLAWNFFPWRERYPSHFVGGALVVDQPQDLANAVQALLSTPELRAKLEAERSAFIAQNLYRDDGQSARRVAQLILDMRDNPRLREAAKHSPAVAPLYIEQALDAYASGHTGEGRDALSYAVACEPRLLANPHILVGLIVQRIEQLGGGRYSDPNAQRFLDDFLRHLPEALFSSPQIRDTVAAHALVNAAFEESARDDLRRARQYMVRAVRYQPGLLNNRGVQSVLLETMLGSRIMSRLRIGFRRVIGNL